jgi:hypothetical protein
LPVWFDFERLGPGDNFHPQIERYIRRDCCCFVAVISRNTENRLQAYFRTEWSFALDRDRSIYFGKKFIFPVIVDDTREPNAVPLRFNELTYAWLPGGKATPAFVEMLKEIVNGP